MLAVLACAGCTSSASPDEAPTSESAVVASTVPVIDVLASAELQARAVERACEEHSCDGRRLLLPVSTEDEVQSAISKRLPAAEFVSEDDLLAVAGPVLNVPDDVVIVRVVGVKLTERTDVRSIEVWIVGTPDSGVLQPYLFRWNGNEWTDVRPEDVGVTTTIAVP